MRARVTPAARPRSPGTPMLVDQRRSRPDRHRVTVLGSFTASVHGAPVPLGSGRPAGRRLPRRAPPPAAPARTWPPTCGPAIPAAHALPLLDEALAEPVAAGTGRRGRTAPLALDPAVDVDLDEAMALVRALAAAAGRPETRPRGPARRHRPAARRRPARRPAAWLAVERERFRQIRLNALEELSAALSAAGRPRRGRRAGRGGGAHRAEPRERPPRADRGAPRPGRDRRGGRAVRRVPGAAALQRRRAPARSAWTGRSGSRACSRPCRPGRSCGCAARCSAWAWPPPACG